MAITASGLGSNLDVNGIVSQLMAIEQQPLTQLAKKEASYQAKLSAFGTLNGALSSLQSAAKTLTNTSTFTGMSASASDSTVLSASATSTAAAGSYNVSVTQLAKNHIVRSNGSYALTDTFNTGTLALTVGSTTTNITIDDTNNTLDGIRAAINSANAGVTATIINDGTSNRLVLSSGTTGSSGAVSIAVTQTGSGATQDLTDFNYSGVDTGTMVQAQAADNALFSINGIAISRSTNSVSDAISGVTLNLAKAGTAQLTVARNTGASKSAIDAFVKAYNDAAKQLSSVSAYNADAKQASVLTGDGTVRSIQSRLLGLLHSSLTGLAGGVSTLSDIGITLQKDGTLSTDSAKLQAALADPGKDVAGLFTSTASGNKGIAVRFNETLDSIVGSSGLIAGRTDGINATIKDIGKQRDALGYRLVQIEKRYRAQFTALDSLVSSMNRTSNYLTQQLANLPKASSS